MVIMIEKLHKKSDISVESNVVVFRDSSTKTGDKFQFDKIAPDLLRRLDTETDLTLRSRYELKYIIDQARAHAIRQYIKLHMKLDKYSRLRNSRYYPVASLYFDSPDLKLCRETLTGKKNRFKLRIRSYTDEKSYPRFLEIKRRLNNVILKSRARLKFGEIDDLLRNRIISSQHKKDFDTINQFQLYLNYLNASPVILVRYLRQAYQADSENTKLRVTFDDKLSYKIPRSIDTSISSSGFRNVLVGKNILEIKFTGRYPAWLSRMIKHFDLRGQSCSKYVKSLKHASFTGSLSPQLMVFGYG